MKNISFALNQIMLPEASFTDFIYFAKKLDIHAIEIRNDIKTNLIKENEPIKVREESEKILSKFYLLMLFKNLIYGIQIEKKN